MNIFLLFFTEGSDDSTEITRSKWFQIQFFVQKKNENYFEKTPEQWQKKCAICDWLMWPLMLWIASETGPLDYICYDNGNCFAWMNLSNEFFFPNLGKLMDEAFQMWKLTHFSKHKLANIFANQSIDPRIWCSFRWASFHVINLLFFLHKKSDIKKNKYQSFFIWSSNNNKTSEIWMRFRRTIENSKQQCFLHQLSRLICIFVAWLDFSKVKHTYSICSTALQNYHINRDRFIFFTLFFSVPRSYELKCP